MAIDRERRFWNFAAAIYAHPEVAAAAIALQDAAGRDVNIALYCAFAGFELGHALDRAALAAIERAVAPWAGTVVAPMRAIRRGLRAFAADPAAAALRDRLLALEMEAERLAQARILAAVPATAAAAAGIDLARANLLRYAGEAGRALAAAIGSALAAGLAPAPDGPAVESEQIDDPA